MTDEPTTARTRSRKRGRSTIDAHPERVRIELALAIGTPARVVAERYGVSHDAAWRHKKKLPPQLKAALAAKTLRPGVDLEKLRIEESEGLLQHLAAQRARLLLLQDRCIESEQITLFSQLSAQLHRNLQLVGEYLGEFARHEVHTSINILVRPEYLQLRAVIREALRPFPDARRAVSEALHRIESEAAKQPVIQHQSQEASANGDAAQP